MDTFKNVFKTLKIGKKSEHSSHILLVIQFSGCPKFSWLALASFHGKWRIFDVPFHQMRKRFFSQLFDYICKLGICFSNVNDMTTT